MKSESANYYARVWEILNFVSKYIHDFEKTFEDKNIQEQIPLVQIVYMHEIIINLWMILGDSRNDKYTLNKISLMFDDTEIQNRASAILSNHDALIAKLKSNRNWISAHIDERLTSLKFSEETSRKFEEQFDAKFPYMRADGQRNERYTPDDMRRDLPEINKILLALKNILDLIPKTFIP